MSIIERFKQLELPSRRCVLIGSGVLDAIGLRSARDIDIAVDPELFAELRGLDAWTEGLDELEGRPFLTKDDTEVWMGWSNRPEHSFQSLYEGGVTIEGVRFAHPRTVLQWKLQAGRPKDADDIKLLQEYLDRG